MKKGTGYRGPPSPLPAQLTESVMFLAAMGIDIRGLGSSISLRKVLSWPSPAHTVPLFRLKPGAGIMNSWQACCPTPSPVADISNQWPHSFLLNLEADLRILSFHYSKQPRLLCLAPHKLKPLSQWSGRVWWLRTRAQGKDKCTSHVASAIISCATLTA